MKRGTKIKKTKEKVRKGIVVYRGESQILPADPGDFGSGKYYSTLESRAKNYGKVLKTEIRLENPYIIEYSEAYRTLSGPYNTLGHNVGMETRKANALKLTLDMVDKGYDGLIAVRKDKTGKIKELEIVDYRQLKEVRVRDIKKNQKKIKKLLKTLDFSIIILYNYNVRR